MKSLRLFAAIVVIASSASARAGDDSRAANPGDRAGVPGISRAEGRRDARPASAVYIESLDKAVGLSDEQKKAIINIFDVRDLALKDFEAKNADKIKAASKNLQDATESHADRDAMGKVRAEYREQLAPMQDIMKRPDDDLANVLTAEQKLKQKEYRITIALKGMAAPVELTEEQTKKLVAMAEAHDGERGGIGRNLSEALDQMLTTEQKETIARHHALAEVMRKYGGDRLLSREQIGEVQGFYEELSRNTTLKADELAKKFADKIDGILTDEQKEAVKNQPARSARGDGAAPRASRNGTTAPSGNGRDGATPVPEGSR